MPYFGFKAKLAVQSACGQSYCTVPYFGFKAKHRRLGDINYLIVLCLILDSRQNRRGMWQFDTELYCALFWIQGKTYKRGIMDTGELYCALFWIQGKTRRDMFQLHG